MMPRNRMSFRTSETEIWGRREKGIQGKIGGMDWCMDGKAGLE